MDDIIGFFLELLGDLVTETEHKALRVIGITLILLLLGLLVYYYAT